MGLLGRPFGRDPRELTHADLRDPNDLAATRANINQQEREAASHARIEYDNTADRVVRACREPERER